MNQDEKIKKLGKRLLSRTLSIVEVSVPEQRFPTVKRMLFREYFDFFLPNLLEEVRAVPKSDKLSGKEVEHDCTNQSSGDVALANRTMT